MDFCVMLPLTGKVASPSGLIEVAQAAEELGFSTVSARDHIIFDGSFGSTIGSDGPGDDRAIFEMLETLTFVASATKRVRLATSVAILPNRHPLLFAKQTSTLDYLSGGRLQLGLGIGPNRQGGGADTDLIGTHRGSLTREYDSFGAIGPRGPRMEEYYQALLRLWSEDAPSFHGEYVSFETAMMFPKPIQRPHPPIVVGGRSSAAHKRAARWGAGWVPSQATTDDIRTGVAAIRALRAEAGLAPDIGIVGISNPSIIADSVDAAVETAAPSQSGHYDGRQDFLDRTISGDLDTWVERVRAYQEAGVNYIELKPIATSVDAFIKQMRQVHDAVMPALA